MSNRFTWIYDSYKNNSKLAEIIKQTNMTKKVVDGSISIEKKYWFSSDAEISNGNNILHINTNKNEKDFLYVSYLEGKDLSYAPTQKVLNKGKYLINFTGEISNKCRTELFIIFYKDNKRYSLKSIPLNSYESITIPENVNVRVAIRIEGKGVMKINPIQIFELKNNEAEINSNQNQVVNILDFKWNLTNAITAFKLNDWYYEKKNKCTLSTSNENELIINSSFKEKDYTYISYKEKNINLSQKPVSEIFDFSSDFIYKVEFNGNKTDTQKVELLTVFYDEKGRKEQVETIFLNAEKLIKPKKSIVSYRLSLRVAGIGQANINSIKITRKKLIENLPFNQLRKMGYGTPKSLGDLNLAVISDEFTTACLEPEVNLIKFGPDDWQAIFEFNKPDLLFVESAWQGNDGKWTGKVGYKNATNTLELQEVINWCRKHDIKTVFWNKEDPVHFNAFIKTAKFFDYIFTTDEGSVDNYKNNLGHENVFVLPFAAQPSMHNPIEIYDRVDKSCFAGSYYAKKYIERQKDMNLLLETAASYGLEIYDRNYQKELPEFYFPENLRKYVVGNLKSSEITKAYKGYKIALNVNSVTESNTMFSRRVFECLASNTPVISTYSKGISYLLGDLVSMSTNSKELKKIFDTLYNDKFKYEERAHRGYREVMQNHTYENRLNFILEKTEFNFNNLAPKVTVLSLVKNSNEAKYILEQFESQDYSNKNLILLVKNNKDLKLIKDNLFVDNIKTLDEYANSEDLEMDIASYFNPMNYYGSNYISDLMLAYKYSDAEIVGKYSYYHVSNNNLILENESYSHKYVAEMSFERALINIKTSSLIKNKELINYIEGNNLNELFHKGLRFYSADKFNFVSNYNTLELSNLDISHILI